MSDPLAEFILEARERLVARELSPLKAVVGAETDLSFTKAQLEALQEKRERIAEKIEVLTARERMLARELERAESYGDGVLHMLESERVVADGILKRTAALRDDLEQARADFEALPTSEQLAELEQLVESGSLSDKWGWIRERGGPAGQDLLDGIVSAYVLFDAQFRVRFHSEEEQIDLDVSGFEDALRVRFLGAD